MCAEGRPPFLVGVGISRNDRPVARRGAGDEGVGVAAKVPLLNVVDNKKAAVISRKRDAETEKETIRLNSHFGNSWKRLGCLRSRGIPIPGIKRAEGHAAGAVLEPRRGRRKGGGSWLGWRRSSRNTGVSNLRVRSLAGGHRPRAQRVRLGMTRWRDYRRVTDDRRPGGGRFPSRRLPDCKDGRRNSSRGKGEGLLARQPLRRRVRWKRYRVRRGARHQKNSNHRFRR